MHPLRAKALRGIDFFPCQPVDKIVLPMIADGDGLSVHHGIKGAVCIPRGTVENDAPLHVQRPAAEPQVRDFSAELRLPVLVKVLSEGIGIRTLCLCGIFNIIQDVPSQLRGGALIQQSPEIRRVSGEDPEFHVHRPVHRRIPVEIRLLAIGEVINGGVPDLVHLVAQILRKPVIFSEIRYKSPGGRNEPYPLTAQDVQHVLIVLQPLP